MDMTLDAQEAVQSADHHDYFWIGDCGVAIVRDS